MKRVSKILVAIDGDCDEKILLGEIGSIVGDDRFSVTILSIMDPTAGDPDENIAVANLHEWEHKVRSLQLEELSKALSGKGIQVLVQHVNGKPYLEIIREALKNEYDLVIKPARQDSGIKRLLLRGTDIQLLSLCPIPVWIFRPTGKQSLKKIAVAIDLQPDDPERCALADKILGWGRFVAGSVDAELHVIHTWSLYREQSLRARSALSDMVDRLSVGKERLHRNWLYDALERTGLGNDDIHEHLLKGEARELIPTTVDKWDIDLLVMGTVGRTGIPGFFIGNTADSVLRNVGCSVLAIKPDNFATPVAPASDSHCGHPQGTT